MWPDVVARTCHIIFFFKNVAPHLVDVSHNLASRNISTQGVDNVTASLCCIRSAALNRRRGRVALSAAVVLYGEVKQCVVDSTRSTADADKPARRVYRLVKVIEHAIIRYVMIC